ncbi:MAG: hypothetical protein NVS2B12_20960 [Ktedonobacteraceae bacterium]
MMQDLCHNTHTPESNTIPAPTTSAAPVIRAACDLTAGHCITCSDEALPVKVVSIDHTSGLAQVEVQNIIEEVDITLVDDIAVGDIVLVHGGVVLGHPDEVADE